MTKRDYFGSLEETAHKEGNRTEGEWEQLASLEEAAHKEPNPAYKKIIMDAWTVKEVTSVPPSKEGWSLEWLFTGRH